MSNARMSIEDAPLNRFHNILTMRTGGGWLLDGYVLSIIGVAMVDMAKALNLSSFWQGMMAASALIGIFFGGFLGGWMSDRMGRKKLYFVAPALFALCSIAQFWAESGIALAVKLANDTIDTIYGLTGSVYSANIKRAIKTARAITINCFGEGDITTPFGGYKQSGFGGRDKSMWAHDQYTELKTIWIDLADN